MHSSHVCVILILAVSPGAVGDVRLLQGDQMEGEGTTACKG